jgi:hypothetical protein
MNAPRTVSQAYVMGISEGRATWQRLERDGIADLQHARECLGHVRECLAMGFAGDVRDMMKGEQDFWLQRIKVLAEQAARPNPIAA